MQFIVAAILAAHLDPMYPSAIREIMDTFPVTRFWGNVRRPVPFELPIPALYARFDCIVHEAVPEKISHGCSTMLCHPTKHSLQRCLHITRGMDVPGKFVCFFGEDTKLSNVRKPVKAIAARFSRAYYEARNVDMPGVDIMPIGIQEFYLRQQDFQKILPLQRRVATNLNKSRPFKVIAAAGAYWNLKNTDRRDIQTLCENPLRGDYISCSVQKATWWQRLASSSHMLNPLGNGHQSPKFYEALLMGVIPVCTRHLVFVRLHALGWPVILLDTFKNVTNATLGNAATHEARRRMQRHYAQFSTVAGMWRYLHNGKFDS